MVITTSSSTGLGRSHPYHLSKQVVYMVTRHRVTGSSTDLGRSQPYHLSMQVVLYMFITTSSTTGLGRSHLSI